MAQTQVILASFATPYGHTMNIMHNFYGNNSLDCLIFMSYLINQAVGRSDRTQEKSVAHQQDTKEITMHAHGHTTVWGTQSGLGRANKTRSWIQQLRDWWTAYTAAHQQANRDVLHRCWDAKRETVTSQRADAAPEMAAAHHAMFVATMLYGLHA
jgi:hypothetical protein